MRRVTLVVRTGTTPQQVTDFPEKCARSCKGSLHVKPGTLEITLGEWKHIQEKHRDLAGRMQVTGGTDVPDKPAPPASKKPVTTDSSGDQSDDAPPPPPSDKPSSTAGRGGAVKGRGGSGGIPGGR